MKNRLKELRLEQNKSLEEIAIAAGVSRASINNYENGNQEPKQITWEKIASFLGVPVPYLMGLSDERRDPSEMTLKELILKANNTTHSYSDSDNAMRSKLLTADIETFAELIINALRNDFSKNEDIGRTTLDFLSTISYLIESDDADSIEALKKIMVYFTGTKRGIFRGKTFVSYGAQKQKKGGELLDINDSVKQYLGISHEIDRVLNDYFIKELNAHFPGAN